MRVGILSPFAFSGGLTITKGVITLGLYFSLIRKIISDLEEDRVYLVLAHPGLDVGDSYSACQISQVMASFLFFSPNLTAERQISLSSRMPWNISRPLWMGKTMVPRMA
jgi:hypothetical protein